MSECGIGKCVVAISVAEPETSYRELSATADTALDGMILF